MADNRNKNFYQEQMEDLMSRYGKKSNFSQPKESQVSKDDDIKSRIKRNDKILDDLESINERNIIQYRNRSIRNRVLIIILAIFLIISVSVLCIVAANIYKQNNVFLYTHGNCSATFYVDDMPLNKFRTPSDIRGNIRLDFDVDVNIKSSGNYNVRFQINIFQDGRKIQNVVYHEPNTTLFEDKHDGYLYSKLPIAGGQRIDIVEGVYIDYDYQDTLNISNFRMEIHIYFENV